MSDLADRLHASLDATGPASSDYDLNKDVVLPVRRALREAAVLIPIVERDHGAFVILTKRSSALKHHPGQIAFPGGKVDDSDIDARSTALREAWEEIGLARDAVTPLGILPPHETVTGFRVTPVLAMVSSGFSPNPEPGEVAEVFEVPFLHVMNANNYQVESRRWRGERRYYFTVPWGPYYIWGATARMLRSLADRMEHGKG